LENSVSFSYEISCGSGRSFAFHLFNEPLCLYRTNDGGVVYLLDLCPHRSAPLNLGHITKEGNLEWVYIPFVSKSSNTAALICARTLPAHEQYEFTVKPPLTNTSQL
jgi:hypothetical protein